MKLSSRACYGIRALVELAAHWNQGPSLLRDIARGQGISLPYLARLMSPLVSAGVVRSTRGARGGVWLARPPREIALSEAITLLEGSTAPMECVNSSHGCPHSETCAPRDVWSSIDRAVTQVLSSTTLQDVLERQCDKERREETMYYI